MDFGAFLILQFKTIRNFELNEKIIIYCILIFLENSPEEYVQPNVNNNNQLTIKETYEGFSENRNTKSSEDTVCNLEESISLSPPEDLHAANLHAANLREIAVKYGPLLRKEKFIFVEQYKRCWAAVYGKFFHIFLSDKDSKPFQSIDLNGWNARSTSSITCRDPNRRVSCFELFKPGKKTYQVNNKNEKIFILKFLIFIYIPGFHS